MINKKNLETIYESVSNPVAVISPDYDIIYLNPSFLKLLSAPNGITPSKFTQLIPKHNFKVKAAIDSLIKNKKEQQFYIYDTVFTSKAILNKANEIDSILTIGENIKLNYHQSLLEAIVSSSEDAIISKTLKGMITSWNNGAEKVFGYTKEEMLGAHISVLIPPKLIQEEELILSKIKLGNHIKHYETERLHKNGSIISISLTVSPVFHEGEIVGASKIARDITSRKLVELELLEINRNLDKKAKELQVSNTELEQFAYVASHDLQEPLRMVTSFLSLLDDKYSQVIDDKGKKYIHFAVDGAKRMRRIILDLLEFSRVGKKGKIIEEIDLNDLMDEIKILLRKQIKDKKAIIEYKNLPFLENHKSPLLQIFQNLIENALKYSKEDVAPKIKIIANDLKTHWQFTVSDNGFGIEKEYFEKIFIIFQRLHLKEEYDGTGIGLAITKKIVENLGGEIWVESVKDKGSDFHFTIKKEF